MKFTTVIKKEKFIGRAHEAKQIEKMASHKHANILVVYGRRRIGKTELIEQTLRKHNLLKFEGLENGDQARQIEHVLYQLSKYTDDPFIAKLKLTRWVEVFDLIHTYIQNKPCILYLEELQWLASYKSDLISELKYVWDNTFRHNPNLLIVLCGSSPSFMINHVLQSRALYNRSMYEIPLKEFTLQETSEFLNTQNHRDTMNSYLTVGGIPEYLKNLKDKSSPLLSICYHAFTRGGFFTSEYQRIFISSLADSKHYQVIIEYLSKKRFATRSEIAAHLKIKAGSYLTELLTDLKLCGFVEHYVPFNVEPNSMLSRYCICDAYLNFYYKFIKPKEIQIEQGNYNDHPTSAIHMDTYQKWLGFSFERFCRRHHKLIATRLGFSGIEYHSGSFFNRNTAKAEPGYQIDLIFDRADNLYTICEIKYLQKKIGVDIIPEFERKLELFPNPRNRTIQKVLISAEGANDNLIGRGYFDVVLTLEDLFKAD